MGGGGSRSKRRYHNVNPDHAQARAAPARAKRLRILWIALGVATRTLIGYRQRAQAVRWYRPSAEAPVGLEWRELDPVRVHRVLKEMQPEAIERLEEDAVVELTAEQAAPYVGQRLPEVPGARPYLVRSLVRFLPGTYAVRVADGYLDVSHGSLGRG
jgi:hypothetical protein